MTQPPEPRRPEEGGGEEDYDAAWENADADEIMGGLEDDALLDSIAQGVRGDLGPDELTELLSGLRDEPDATDIPMKNTARVERGENVLEPPGPRQTSEGNTNPVSAQDESARLRQLAQETGALGALQQLAQLLADTRVSVTSALGEGHSRLGDALAPFQTAEQQAAELQGVIAAAYANLDGIAGQIG